MYGILLSAVGAAFGFVFRSLVVKFGVFFALFFITSEFFSFVSSKLPDASSINGTLGYITSGTWYFLDLFGFTYGFPLVISAYVLRFMIRRIPVIG